MRRSVAPASFACTVEASPENPAEQKRTQRRVNADLTPNRRESNAACSAAARRRMPHAMFHEVGSALCDSRSKKHQANRLPRLQSNC